MHAWRRSCPCAGRSLAQVAHKLNMLCHVFVPDFPCCRIHIAQLLLYLFFRPAFFSQLISSPVEPLAAELVPGASFVIWEKRYIVGLIYVRLLHGAWSVFGCPHFGIMAHCVGIFMAPPTRACWPFQGRAIGQGGSHLSVGVNWIDIGLLAI